MLLHFFSPIWSRASANPKTEYSWFIIIFSNGIGVWHRGKDSNPVKESMSPQLRFSCCLSSEVQENKMIYDFKEKTTKKYVAVYVCAIKDVGDKNSFKMFTRKFNKIKLWVNQKLSSSTHSAYISLCQTGSTCLDFSFFSVFLGYLYIFN
jgi:hypothetical protein